MSDIANLLQHGSSILWLFIPGALALGALHGLEPGHSKTMMAAFIVAIRGTVAQAVMLGLAATASHTVIVWLIALSGLYFGRNLDLATSEPYFQLASATIILAVAGWMFWRTWREQKAEAAEHPRHHDADDEVRRIDIGHGLVALSIVEDGTPPRFRLALEQGHGPPAADVTVTTLRANGREQRFYFSERAGVLESLEVVPEPHDFTARLSIAHGGRAHDYDVAFGEDGHAHDGLDLGAIGFQDAHEQAHADDILRRFKVGHATTGQIIVFGLTGGLIPCPASITVLLLCLQLRKVAMGALLVLCFSIGLAVTMVLVGVIAALGMRQAERRWSTGFAALARRAPYVSGALIGLVGLALAWRAWTSLAR